MCKKELKDLTPELLSQHLIDEQLSYRQIAEIYNTTKQAVNYYYNKYKKWEPELFARKYPYTKEELERALKEGVTNFCKEKNVTHYTFTKMLKYYGIQNEKIMKNISLDELRTLYVDYCCDDELLSKYYKCKPNTVSAIRYRNNIVKSQRKSVRELITPDVFYDLYVNERISLSQISHVFPITMQMCHILKNEYSLLEGKYNRINTMRNKAVPFAILEKVQKKYYPLPDSIYGYYIDYLKDKENEKSCE